MNQFQSTSIKLNDLRAEQTRLAAALVSGNRRKTTLLMLKEPDEAQKLDIKKTVAFVKATEHRMTTVVSSIAVLEQALRNVGNSAKQSQSLSGKRMRF